MLEVPKYGRVYASGFWDFGGEGCRTSIIRFSCTGLAAKEPCNQVFRTQTFPLNPTNHWPLNPFRSQAS